MKIFLDTANLDEIQQASDFGLLDGITTNPTLAAREGQAVPRAHSEGVRNREDRDRKRRSGIHGHRRDAARGARTGELALEQVLGDIITTTGVRTAGR